MILANLAKAVREQNYYAVVLEFLIVIAGVVIGFQITAWNEAEANRDLEQDYLLRLHNDLRCMVYGQIANLSWDETRVQTQQVVIDALSSGQLDDADEPDFNRGLALLGIHNPLRWQWGTVNELNNTGNITLIRDTGLRARLGQAESDYQRDKRIIEVAVDQIEVSRSKITHFYRPVQYGFNATDGAVIDYDLETLSTDPSFQAELSHLQLNSRVIYAFSTGHRNNLVELERLLANIRGVMPLPVDDIDISERPDCDTLINELDSSAQNVSS